MPSNAVGVSLALAGAVLSNFGTNLQKRTHMIDAKLPVEARTHYYARPLWWFGFFLVSVGALADFIALGQGTVSLVTAVGGAAVMTMPNPMLLSIRPKIVSPVLDGSAAKTGSGEGPCSRKPSA